MIGLQIMNDGRAITTGIQSVLDRIWQLQETGDTLLTEDELDVIATEVSSASACIKSASYAVEQAAKRIKKEKGEPEDVPFDDFLSLAISMRALIESIEKPIDGDNYARYLAGKLKTELHDLEVKNKTIGFEES